MAKAVPSEKQVERAIREYLELHGWIVYKTDAGEAARAARERGRRGSLHPGAPDLIALKGGRGFAVEVKRPGGRLRSSQRLEHARLADAGVPVVVAYGLEDVERFLRSGRIEVEVRDEL